MIEDTIVNAFLSGGVAIASAMIGVCFVRYWRRSGIRLFLFFAIAFYLLTIERVVLVIVNPDNEFAPYIYLIRLAAFLVIIAAIADQNRKRS
jgi:uncharacterized membrane protein